MNKLLDAVINLENDYDKKICQSLTVSAIRRDWNSKLWIEEINTTDFLLRISSFLKEINSESPIKQKELIKKEILKIVNFLNIFHSEVLYENFSSKNDLSEELNKKILKSCIKIVNEEFNFLKKSIENYLNWNDFWIIDSKNDYSIKGLDWDLFSILWFGEILAQKIIVEIINTKNNKIIAIWVNVKKVSKNIKKCSREIWDFDSLIYAIKPELENIFKEKRIPIISWYFWWFQNWIKNSFNRWYSDATGAAVAVAQKKINWKKESILQIQKSVDSILSWDPRIIKWTKKIPILSYFLSRNITWIKAGAWAKVLNSYSLSEEVQEEKIKIHIVNPLKNTEWTWILPEINSKDEEVEKLKFVWWQKEISLVIASSTSKSIRAWFFSEIAEIVKSEWISMDHIYTAETSIMFTIQAWKKTIKLKKELKRFLWKDWNVSINDNVSLIWVFWENIHYLDEANKNKNRLKRNFEWTMAQMSLHKDEITYLLSSSWALNWVNTYVIERRFYEKALKALHLTLI